MARIIKLLAPAAVAALALAITGCILSATFVVNYTFKFQPGDEFYSYRIDLTGNATWQDHKDNIDLIEMVGFILYLNSSETDTIYFNAYIDEAEGDAPDPSSVPGTAKLIIDELPVKPGHTVITYAQSLGIVTNLDALKKLTKTGKFDFYGVSTGDDGNTFKIDSITVVVTFMAS